MLGRLQTSSYDGKKQYFTEVVADEVILLGGRDGGAVSPRIQAPVSLPCGTAAPAAVDTNDWLWILHLPQALQRR